MTQLASSKPVLTLAEFLHTVITTDEGWACLLVGPPSSKWYEQWFWWPTQEAELVQFVKDHTDCNLYFSAHLFSTKNSAKANVIGSHTIQADLDNANIDELPVTPTVLVETSPGRHQAYWVLEDEIDEALSKQVTYSIPDCDLSGWSLGHKVRLPETYNYKYVPRTIVRIKSVGQTVTRQQVETRFTTNVSVDVADPDQEWIDSDKSCEKPLELLESIRDRLPRKVYAQYNRTQTDRSTALWALMLRAFVAGCTRDEVWCLAKHSANNKFADNKYNGDRDLAKDVLRAERAHFSSERAETGKQIIKETRRLPGTAQEVKQFIADSVIQMLKAQGEFATSDDGQYWFLDHTRGKPVLLAKASQELDNILITEFGINPAEREASFVVNELMGEAYKNGKRVANYSLSWFDWPTRSVLLHNGTSDVYQIDKAGLHRGHNGQYGVVFPWILGVQPFYIGKPLDEDWCEWCFDGFFHNLEELTREQALALVRVWVMFLFFRNASDSRPILALFGQPGSGKSAFFRIVYRILYGTRKSLDAISNSDNFDQTVSTYPLAVFDNVDTYTPWLADRLALAASTSDVVKRKLYTDSDNIVMKRQAMVGITAHNPKFGREDIVDRLILLNLERLEHFNSETEMLRRIDNERDRIWGSIVQDLQIVLNTDWPSESTIPEFRINDFAKYGIWIAKALGIETVFREALENTKHNQLQYNLTEDGILIEALDSWVRKRESVGNWYTHGQLWEYLLMNTSDPNGFMRSYKNTKVLGKKLRNMQETLDQLFNTDRVIDSESLKTKWRIDPK